MNKRSISKKAIIALMKWAQISSNEKQQEVAEKITNYEGDIDFNTMLYIISGK